MTIPQALEMALQHHQSGRLAEAEALYRQILAAQPDHAEALRLLGVVAHQSGRHDLAVGWIRESIALKPNNSAAYFNLAKACRALGQLKEAIGHYRRGLALEPCHPQALVNLGATLVAHGQLDEAIAAYRQAIQIKPDFPEAHSNLGNALREQGQLDEAGAACRRALELRPDFPEAHNNLGAVFAAQGQLSEAIAAYRRALELKPDLPEAHNNLGNALMKRGQLDEAIAVYRHALRLKPDWPEAQNNLGMALSEGGQLDEAINAYRRALEIDPGLPEAPNNLGNALKALGQLDEAIGAYRDALRLKPDYAEAWNNLGNAFRSRGELDEAIGAYRRALQITHDNPGIQSNLIYALHFHPRHDVRSISDEQQRWNRQFGDPLKTSIRPHTNDPSPDRRLRVGYVSPDLRDHPAGRYLLPLLEGHDRDRFEIFCYSDVARTDWMTGRLRALTEPIPDPSRGDPGGGGWRNTAGVSDARLAEMIRADEVDILVDLALHTAGNRLPVFARQPAPVQVTWLGYPGSTGLDSIDYRLTDAHMDPLESRNRGTAWSAEEPVRLQDCWCCYQPVDESPEINALPAFAAEGVTFGSLNNFAKVNDGVLALWARLLGESNSSRMVMFCPQGRTRERVLAFFAARGIEPERVELVGFLPRQEYLNLYRRIDLALDPFPCNGMTTTCDALWMGVPVLTLPGEMPVSRAGLSLLSTIGLGELAASSEDDYVRTAVELAGDLPRLANLRATLRARMEASPLMDAPRFASNVEAAYRSMWKRWRFGQTKDECTARMRTPSAAERKLHGGRSRNVEL